MNGSEEIVDRKRREEREGVGERRPTDGLKAQLALDRRTGVERDGRGGPALEDDQTSIAHGAHRGLEGSGGASRLDRDIALARRDWLDAERDQDPPGEFGDAAATDETDPPFEWRVADGKTGGDRFDQRRATPVECGRDPAEPVLRQDERLREPAITFDTHPLMRDPSAARHSVADPEIPYTRPHRGDDADDLVAQHAWLHTRKSPLGHGHISAAKTCQHDVH